MSDDLPARLLTCAGYIAQLRTHNTDPDTLWTVNAALIIDVEQLLTQAADRILALDPPKPEELGELMEIINPLPPKPSQAPPAGPYFQDPGISGQAEKYRSPQRACPKCDSRALKTVRRGGPTGIMLECPVCQHKWPYRPQAEWT